MKKLGKETLMPGKDHARSLWKSGAGSIWLNFGRKVDFDLLNKSVHGTNLVRPLLDPRGGTRSGPGAHKRSRFHRFQFPSDLNQITPFYLPEKRSHGVNPIRTSETPP